MKYYLIIFAIAAAAFNQFGWAFAFMCLAVYCRKIEWDATTPENKPFKD